MVKCKATSKTTKKKCKLNAGKNSKFCHIHENVEYEREKEEESGEEEEREEKEEESEEEEDERNNFKVGYTLYSGPLHEYGRPLHEYGRFLEMDEDDLDLPLYEIINRIGEKEGYDYPMWYTLGLSEEDKNDRIEQPIRFLLGERHRPVRARMSRKADEEGIFVRGEDYWRDFHYNDMNGFHRELVVYNGTPDEYVYNAPQNLKQAKRK
jgi:hypothetical protein